MLHLSPVALAALLALSPAQEKDDDNRAYGQEWQTVEKTRHYKIFSMVGGSIK